MVENSMENLSTMADPIAEPLAPDQSLYQSFLAERDEILKHKWIKSEQAGADVGFETAIVDWALNHRETWKKATLAGHHS
jgi:hypothetical protein